MLTLEAEGATAEALEAELAKGNAFLGKPARDGDDAADGTSAAFEANGNG